MSNDLYTLTSHEEQTLVRKLQKEGVITVEDFSPLDSRVMVKKVKNTLQRYFVNELKIGGEYFGGEVVDSYFIYNEDNESGIEYTDAIEIFNIVNNERNE